MGKVIRGPVSQEDVSVPMVPTTSEVGTGPHIVSVAGSKETNESAQPALDAPTAVDARGLSLTIVGVGAAILLARYMQDVLVPFVLAGLVFYALDPLVDRLVKVRIPRFIGAGLVLGVILVGVGLTAYSLQDDALAIVEGLPAAARTLRAEIASRRGGTSAVDTLQRAAAELDETAAAASGPAASQPGDVVRVRVEEPPFRAADYLPWNSLTAVSILGQAALILFLTYFLLVYDDLFKRKLVEIIGPTLTKKKLTVQILNDIAGQIERFLLVQVFTSFVVALVTALALWWVGLRQPALWGLAAGVLNSIPYFGPLIVTVALTIVAFIQFGTAAGAVAIGCLALFITSLEGWILTPILLGRVAEMNRIAIFAGLLFWSWMWGIPGMLLAVPMMMVVKVIADHVEELSPIGKLLGE